MKEERWAAIPGYEGHYEASTEGRVRSVERDVRVRLAGGGYYLRRMPARVLVQHSRGYRSLYKYVNLRLDGVQESMSVHKAVLLAFVGPPEDSMHEALHGPNHDPADNRLCNLRWGSHAENNDDRNRVNGYCGYVIQRLADEEAEIDAQARREGWEGTVDRASSNGTPF